jgi:hypothetical protein
MWPHLLTQWPPLGKRAIRFLSTLNTRFSSTSGLSNLGGWVGAGLLRPIMVEDQDDGHQDARQRG